MPSNLPGTLVPDRGQLWGHVGVMTVAGNECNDTFSVSFQIVIEQLEENQRWGKRVP